MPKFPLLFNGHRFSIMSWSVTVLLAAGDTGNLQGVHLHLEVRQNGGFINPWFVLP